ncbi:rhamnose ABC transporter substrate-binding protein [Klenkia terrae]|jgi:rhamnose transport system substrate-binding protein|uniref:Rhamnose ABC transporter substrate-binding protein n=1 Tax=Klenkia terrae TaxID=1052259 RepID=A0ABU8E473_9ACTN|nr:rhamnose ABC transporter substrate-binding protein [Klenkia terrae]SSC26093.1 Rhamnose ABC transporter, substrate-binding protein RhaS [Klenkia terrae]
MTSFLTARPVRRAITGTAVAAVLLSAAACGGTTRGDDDSAGGGSGSTAEADPDAEIPSGLSVAFLPKQLNNPYFSVADGGGEQAVGEFDGEYSEVGPSEASASSQVSYINTLTQQGADVIVTSANDPNAICSALDQARAAGASVVTFDSDTDPECRDVFINQATAEGIAETQIDEMADQIGGTGQVAILSATANATNQNTWIELMTEYAASEYPDMEIVTTVYGDDEDEKSFQETQGLLQTYPDLAGIISPTTVGIAAAARYLSGSEYKGQVALTGLGTPNQMREFVEDGTVTSFALWNPEDLGYLAAWAGAALAAGQITGEEGQTFTAGDLGEYTVGADGEIVLGDPTVFNADNIADFDF